MADEADMAQERTEVITAAALAHREEEAPKDGTGKCFWCDAPFTKAGENSRVLEVDMTRRWCGPECRDMWEIWRRRKK